MTRFPVGGVGLLLAVALGGTAEGAVHRWRVGDAAHPWALQPVSGRLSWGRGWACEILVDDDGDDQLDEDGVELIDNDGDALINEDGPDRQVDNDGDGRLSEDPVDNRDNDGDGSIDEDPLEAFDSDYDGLVDEDGPDPQIDDDGDGRLNEDGRFSNLDDDYDGRQNCDPLNGLDDDGDGLVDEDPPLPEDQTASKTIWLSPIRLDPNRNLLYELNQRYLQGEFGGLVPGMAELQKPYMLIPDDKRYRVEIADPIFATRATWRATVDRNSYGPMVDGDLMTAFGSSESDWGLGANLMGLYRMNRVVFRPRPSLPGSTMRNFIIYFGNEGTYNPTMDMLDAPRVMFAAVYEQASPPVHDLRLSEPVRAGGIDIKTLNPWASGRREEIAEAGFYGQGYPFDACYISEIIDLGPETPRVRRYTREIEQFAVAEAAKYTEEFKDVAGNPANWGKVRWKGRRIGTGGDIRIQFRTGNSLDTHIYARRLGANLVDTRDEKGKDLGLFAWIKLTEGRVPEPELQYNELGAAIGNDGTLGWSYWSAPMSFAEGLIDESLPPERWQECGVQLPIPGGTRYLQMRVYFDNTEDSACLLDYIEFEYDAPLVSGGVLAEIYPAEVPLGEEVIFSYFLRPQFATGERTEFNRIEIDVPAADTHIDALTFDDQPWVEVPGSGTSTDPLMSTVTRRLPPTAGAADSVGQFAQAVVTDLATGDSKLLIKLASSGARNFSFEENIELSLRSRLYRGAKEFSSLVWNDQVASRASMIPQPTQAGDVTAEVATDGIVVVARQLGALVKKAEVAPNPFTPNGDGIRDQVCFAFELYLVQERVQPRLAVYDLSGRKVRRLDASACTAGRIEITWDGRDSEGNLVPPGTYLYRLRVGSDREASVHTGLLAVVY